MAVRNTVVVGEVRLTAQFSPNLYMGNHAGADGTYVPLRWGRGSAAFEAVDARELAEAATGRRLRSGEVSAYWTGQALAYIRSAPGDWLRLMLWKWLLVWHVTEIGDTIDEYTYAEWSVVLRTLQHVVHFGIVAPLAAFGICLAWPDRRRNGLLLVMVAVYAASVALFFIMSRYRLPLVPLLLPFVAAGLLQGFALLSRERRSGAGTFVLPGAVALAVAAIVNWPLVLERLVRATTHTNIGIHLATEVKAPERAIAHFERALALNPGYVEAHGNLGAVLAMRGETDRALAHLDDALRLKPDYIDGHDNAGLVLGRLGRAGEAIRHFAETVRLRPDHADAHHALGFYLAAAGDLPGAKAHYLEGLRLVPDYPDVNLGLGILFLREGRSSDAALHLATAVRVRPDSVPARYNLGSPCCRTVSSSPPLRTSAPRCAARTPTGRFTPSSRSPWHGSGDAPSQSRTSRKRCGGCRSGPQRSEGSSVSGAVHPAGDRQPPMISRFGSPSRRHSPSHDRSPRGTLRRGGSWCRRVAPIRCTRARRC